MNPKKHWIFSTKLDLNETRRIASSTVPGKVRGGVWQAAGRTTTPEGVEADVFVFEPGMLASMSRQGRHAAGNELSLGYYPDDADPSRTICEMWMSRRKSVGWSTAMEPAIKQRLRSVRDALQSADPSLQVESMR